MTGGVVHGDTNMRRVWLHFTLWAEVKHGDGKLLSNAYVCA